MIKIANKKQEELINKQKQQTRYTVRIAFWIQLLQAMNEKSDLFKNISPSKDNWIGCGSGHGSLEYVFAVTGNEARIELYINRGSQEENKALFDWVHDHKETIEKQFGDQLEWQRLDESKGSRIAYRKKDVSVFNEEDWPTMIEFLTVNMIKFEQSLKNTLKNLMSK